MGTVDEKLRHCPYCGRTVEVKQDSSGFKVKCKTCGTFTASTSLVQRYGSLHRAVSSREVIRCTS